MDPCEQYIEAISLDVDGCLDEAARRALEEHLAVCPRCTARRAAFAALHDGLAGWEETPPDTLLPGIRYQVRRTRGRRSGRWPRRMAPLAAVAAVVALLLVMQERLPQIAYAPGTAQSDTKQAPGEGVFYAAKNDSDDFTQEGGDGNAPGAALTSGDATGSAGGDVARSDMTDAAVPPAAVPAPSSTMPDGAPPMGRSAGPPVSEDVPQGEMNGGASDATNSLQPPAEMEAPGPLAMTTAVATPAPYAYVIRWAAAVPEELASLARVEYDDRTEIVASRMLVETWWPVWSEAGARRDVDDTEEMSAESDDVPDDVLVIFEK
ncbi:MAG: zf-HC2 domain-containing protein [Oscillospiraceae bacterium]|jgi:hypothetical protein|nr:zf-HC2 domain-containing protein [Oscillospiraceae bacterium]